MTTKRIVWTVPSKDKVFIETPAPKAVAELGLKDFDELVDYIIANRLPKDAKYYVCECDELPERKYRDAWVCNHDKKCIDLDPVKCKRIDAIRAIEEEAQANQKSDYESKIKAKMAELNV